MTPHVATTAARTAALLAALATAAPAQTVTSAQFVNGLAISGGTLDRSAGSAFDRRVGFFSDLYYDAGRGEWWGVSDRGPGGGSLPYETRVQRFTLDVNPLTGAIGNFQVQQTVKFTTGGAPLDGLAPMPTNVLGNAFDPEGFVINPRNGHLLVSDEYGPSLVEFDRDGNQVRRFATPANLVPRNAVTGVPNYAGDAGNTAGKRTNRGFEGLAVSPDGRFAYAMLQSATLDEGGAEGLYTRLVKFDVATGEAVGQYAYTFETAAQGRGVSALVALGNDQFLVLERNNRGVGVGATLAGADKAVYAIDLAGATDISTTVLAGGVLPAGVVPVAKGAKVLDLDANTLAALGGRSPEKWEGLAVGPRLADGRYLILAGTDNDYSVTQNDAGAQFDVWFDFSLPDPYAQSIQCPIGATTGCFLTANAAAPAVLTGAYQLLPGVLHAYAARLDGYVAPSVVPEPRSVVLAGAGLALGAAGAAVRRRARPAA